MKKMLLVLLIFSGSQLLAQPQQVTFQDYVCGTIFSGLNRVSSSLASTLYAKCISESSWNTCATQCNVPNVPTAPGFMPVVYYGRYLTDAVLNCVRACTLPLPFPPTQLLKCADFYANGTVISGTPSGYGSASCSYTYNGNTYPNLIALNEGLGYCAYGYANGAPFKYNGTGDTTPNCQYSFPAGTAPY